MKLLIVCSGNFGRISPFVLEQVKSLNQIGLQTEYFIIKGKGIIGYLKNYPALRKKIKQNNFNLIHAHYGLSGFLSNLQRIIPVITTIHGGDIDIPYVKPFSIFAMVFSKKIIHVNNLHMRRLRFFAYKSIMIPCGVDLKNFYPIKDRYEVRKRLGFKANDKVILFSSSFSRTVKNASLAKKAVEIVKKIFPDTVLIELVNYSREEINLLFNAADLLLLTSTREASPQTIKEALATNCPIVSTDVGDIKETITGLEGCHLISFEPNDIAEKILEVFNNNKRTDGRQKIEHLSLPKIADKLANFYQFSRN